MDQRVYLAEVDVAVAPMSAEGTDDDCQSRNDSYHAPNLDVVALIVEQTVPAEQDAEEEEADGLGDAAFHDKPEP